MTSRPSQQNQQNTTELKTVRMVEVCSGTRRMRAETNKDNKTDNNQWKNNKNPDHHNKTNTKNEINTVSMEGGSGVHEGCSWVLLFFLSFVIKDRLLLLLYCFLSVLLFLLPPASSALSLNRPLLSSQPWFLLCFVGYVVMVWFFVIFSPVWVGFAVFVGFCLPPPGPWTDL